MGKAQELSIKLSVVTELFFLNFVSTVLNLNPNSIRYV